MDFAHCVNSHSVANWDEDQVMKHPSSAKGLASGSAAALPDTGMLWGHQLQPAAAWGEISHLQVSGGEGNKRSEVKQFLGVTHP